MANCRTASSRGPPRPRPRRPCRRLLSPPLCTYRITSAPTKASARTTAPTAYCPLCSGSVRPLPPPPPAAPGARCPDEGLRAARAVAAVPAASPAVPCRRRRARGGASAPGTERPVTGTGRLGRGAGGSCSVCCPVADWLCLPAPSLSCVESSDLSGPQSPSVKWGQISSFSREGWGCQGEQTWVQGPTRGGRRDPSTVCPAPPACPSVFGFQAPPHPRADPTLGSRFSLPSPGWLVLAVPGRRCGLSLLSVLISRPQWLCRSPVPSTRRFLPRAPTLTLPTHRHAGDSALWCGAGRAGGGAVWVGAQGRIGVGRLGRDQEGCGFEPQPRCCPGPWSSSLSDGAE